MNNTPLYDIPISVLDLIPIAEGNSVTQAFQNSVELAQQTEALGYNRFWLAEHHSMPNIASAATTLLMNHIANHTEKIRVGSGGIMLPNHSPLIVAEQIGTLEALFPGRIDLGLGRAPGTDPDTAAAIRSDRMTAAHHFPYEIEKIQRYMASNNQGQKVRAFIAEGAEVPIYILGSSTDSAYLAASMGVPYVFASHFAPKQFLEALDIYRKNFQPSAELKEPYVIACVNVITADTDNHAEYLSSTLKQMFLGIVTGNLRKMPPPVDNMDAIWSPYHKEAAESMLTYSFIGSKETVGEKAKDFIEKTGVNEIMAVSHIFDHQERIKSYRLFAELFQ
ncbi:luciferase family oxidoreductase, group 1 [Pustulibacterium marinum]|uniref:Luciferase-like monooxygenase n=1 Tax=Pustulibacterium marinum TaxID=1224947 RepID=A0A1I7EXE3_9FLAO|nr:LLM class flavin-dependent oxidoreductase [Pustulibacterium marinum]SFU28620.1 luciferase family oxidoreductase, group 1 [Pustulibacterium marinum]